MRTELWFYSGPPRLFDRLIRLWTGSRFSHVELVVDNIAYGADAWEGKVRTKFVNTFNPEHWDVVPVALVKDRTWINAQVGKKYDWLGIFGFFMPFRVQDKRRWYCSEFCAELTGVETRPISPQKLFDAVR
jgi:hypothetical protein